MKEKRKRGKEEGVKQKEGKRKNEKMKRIKKRKKRRENETNTQNFLVLREIGDGSERVITDAQ